MAEKTAAPRSQTKAVNKKQRTTKIQKQTLENINKVYNHQEQRRTAAEPASIAEGDAVDLRIDRGDPSAAPGGRFIRNTSRGQLTG